MPDRGPGGAGIGAAIARQRRRLSEPASRAAGFPSRSFRAMWAATGVSQAGSAVSMVVIPLIAAATLHASAGQMAWLAAADLAPSMLIQVPAAAWSDRLRRRVPVLAACNLVQAAIVTGIPLLWWAGAFGYPVLLLLAALASLSLGVYASLASPLLVQVVPGEHLVEANGKLSSTRSVAGIAGPAAAGVLLAVVSAPLVVLLDAVSFALSAGLLTRVRARPRAEPEAPASVPAKRDQGAMIRFAVAVARRPATRAVVAVGFVNGLTQAILVLFLVHDLHLRPSVISLLFAVGAVGGISGGLLAGRCQRHLGDPGLSRSGPWPQSRPWRCFPSLRSTGPRGAPWWSSSCSAASAGRS